MRNKNSVFPHPNSNDRSLITNKRLLDFYYYQLLDMTINCFHYENLPESVDERYLELLLARNGKVVFFRDEIMDYVIMATADNGQLDIYNIPTERTGYAVTGYNVNLNIKNSVLIFNNQLHTPMLNLIEIYADRLARCDIAINVNLNNQKTPVLFQCEESQRLNVQNLIMQWDGGKPIIVGNDNMLKDNSVTTLFPNVPFIADDIQSEKSIIMNEFLTFLGVDNFSSAKKERLVEGETAGNDGLVNLNKLSRMNAREQAVAKINKMFGLDIKVIFSPQLVPINNIEMGLKDGEIHNGVEKPNLNGI